MPNSKPSSRPGSKRLVAITGQLGDVKFRFVTGNRNYSQIDRPSINWASCASKIEKPKEPIMTVIGITSAGQPVYAVGAKLPVKTSFSKPCSKDTT